MTAQLAYLLQEQARDERRRSKVAAMQERMRSLVGDPQPGDGYALDHYGVSVTIHKIEGLTPEQAARVINLLRELRRKGA